MTVPRRVRPAAGAGEAAPFDVDVHVSSLPLAKPFVIARAVFNDAKAVTVRVARGGVVGRGQCVPQARNGETLESVAAEIARAAASPLSRERLGDLLPAGAARNGLDCALWDFEAKRSGAAAWRIANLSRVAPVPTAYTLSLASPADTRDLAGREAARPLLKVKLGLSDDVERLEAVRAGAPRARIIGDANESWSPARLDDMAPVLERLGVEMVEQPLPAAQDGALSGRRFPFAVCADESCRDRSSLPAVLGRYDMVNIKLDKAGGLTEAFALRRAAEAAGLRVMVGCGVATSLALAPAVLLAQGAEIADLDGPLFLSEDCPHGLVYDGPLVHPPAPALWG